MSVSAPMLEVAVTWSATPVATLRRLGISALGSPLVGETLPAFWVEGYTGGLFVPFLDATSGTETYGAGRYLLDTAKSADHGVDPRTGELILDFNMAFHPSCVYDPRWACPLAPPDARLSMPIHVGERLPVCLTSRRPLGASRTIGPTADDPEPQPSRTEPDVPDAIATFSPDVRHYLETPLRHATLATVGVDGTPHVTVVWYRLDGDAILVNSRVGRRWPTELEADPALRADDRRRHDRRGALRRDPGHRRGRCHRATGARRYPGSGAALRRRSRQVRRAGANRLPAPADLGGRARRPGAGHRRGPAMTRPKIGYAAMLEQFHPTELRRAAARPPRRPASTASWPPTTSSRGCPQQGQAAFVWTFMTAAAERTTGDIGPGVTCPSFRLHPAIVAQAAATLAAMYPGPLLARASARARRSTSTSSPATGPRRPSGSPACSRRSRSSASSSAGKDVKHGGRVLQAWRRRGCGRCPTTPPPIYVATAGPDHGQEDGQAVPTGSSPSARREEKIETLFEQVLARAAREAGKDPADDAESSCSSTCRGPRPTRRRCATRWSSGPTAA